MGVQGLTSLLEKNARAQVVCRKRDPAATATADGEILLVDASAVQFVLFDRLRSRKDWSSIAFHESLYREVVRFYSGLQQCGLRCVLICDGAPSPGHERTYVQRRR